MEKLDLILKIVIAILGGGIVYKVIKFDIRLWRNHIAIGKNIDNSHVESGAVVNKIIGDNATMNVGTKIYYQDEEPETNGEQVVWIGSDKEEV